MQRLNEITDAFRAIARGRALSTNTAVAAQSCKRHKSEREMPSEVSGDTVALISGSRLHNKVA